MKYVTKRRRAWEASGKVSVERRDFAMSFRINLPEGSWRMSLTSTRG